jgi:tetratricopeptide (TPR) repeat protein
VACLLVALGLLRERARRLAAVSAIALALVSALTLAGGAARGEEREGGDVPAARSLHGRAWIWRSSAVAARDALPVGSGLGTFARSYHDAQGRALSRLAPSVAARTYENATTAHQEYLQIATESGPLAAAAFALALALGALAHARSRFWGGAGALVACAVTSLGDSPFRQPAVVLLAALVLGACRARDSDTKTKRAQRSGTLARLSALALVLLAAWALEVSVRAWLSTFDAPPDARLRLLLRSARVSESNGEPRLELGLLHLAAGEPHAALADLAAADARLADPGIRAARGQAFLVLGDAIAAERSYRAALSWNPGSVRARVGLAESLVRQERLDEAEAEARIARKLSPGSAQVRELSDAIHEGMSDE